jgi:hypothetical protein
MPTVDGLQAESTKTRKKKFIIGLKYFTLQSCAKKIKRNRE